MFLITLQLEDGKNYWCGQKRSPEGLIYEEWDTDINYAERLTPKQSRKQLARLVKLTGSEEAKRELENKFSKS